MDKEEKMLRTILKTSGCFATKQRLDLFRTLQSSPALTIQQLVATVPPQDEATVYRNIKLFEELGIVSRLQLGWHSKVELSDQFHHHHHHFTCLKCGCVIALDENPKVERAIHQLTHNQNFKATDHQLEIRGYCQNCYQE